MKKMNKKGFTLAELLIVVAIIAVLVAIAIPVFTSQLEVSKQAVDKANTRSAYGEAVAKFLGDNETTGTITLAGVAYGYSVNADSVVEISMNTAANAKSKYYQANAIHYSEGGFNPAGSRTE